jgi:hypothetical protein
MTKIIIMKMVDFWLSILFIVEIVVKILLHGHTEVGAFKEDINETERW